MGVTFMQSGRFGGAADPGLTLLQGATLWLDASDDIANSQWIRNKGTGGRSLDAREGSVGSAQIVKGALKLPGTTGNYASAPDNAAYDGFGTIDLVVRLAAADWTPSATQYFLTKWAGAVASSYAFGITSAGLLQIVLTEDGSTGISGSSSVSPTIADGAELWVRVLAAPGGTDGTAIFYTSPDGTTWTQLGTTQTLTGYNTTIFASSASLNLSAHTNGTISSFNGTVYRAQIWSGNSTSGGTKVFDADFTAVSDLATSFTESSSNAATVTINSTTGVDTNDPLLLTHAGTNYLYLPGIASNNASTPDAAALDITGVVDIIVQMSMYDWTPGSFMTVLSKGTDTAAVSGYRFEIADTGALRFSNVTTTAVQSSSLPTVTDGSVLWVRALATPSTDVKFYTSTDGSSWTQLGTTQAFAASWVANASPLVVGGRNTTGETNHLTGNVFRAQIWSGDSTSGGTKQFDANFTTNTNQSSFTESSSNAATVTINRATSGRKAVMVTRPVWLFGTDDYMEIADNALLDFAAAESGTVLTVMRRFGSGSNQRIVTKKFTGGANTGYEMGFNSSLDPFFRIADGTVATTVVTSTSMVSGVSALVGFVRDVGADQLQGFIGSSQVASSPATDTTTATLNSTNALRIGANATPSEFLDGEIIAVAVFRSALTSTELGQIATYYGV